MRKTVLPYKALKKSKIASKTLNVNMLLLVLILAPITVVASLIVSGISNDASLNLARFYSIEAVDKFNAYISQDLALVKKVAHSKAVVGWFADEESLEKKMAAHNEMMDYAGLLDSAELYFGINRSLNEFSIDNGASLEDFYSQSKLDPDDPIDAWYFELCNSNNEYAFNIDIDKYSLERRLWINHKVVSDGTLVGVFCSGLNLEAILESMFAKNDTNNVRGYVIDRLGQIQLISGISGSETEKTSVIQMESPDSVFAKEIDSYLANIEGYFGPNSQPLVFKLSKGPYRFVSIAPISYSDWSVVTFFNSRSLFDVSHLLPLLAVILAAFIFYSAAGGILMNRQVFVPLKSLTESLAHSESHSGVIFGSERDDEFGELSQTIGYMRDRLNAYNAEMIHSAKERVRQDQLLHAVNQAAVVLLSSLYEEEFEGSLQEGMELMARCMDADRVYIWKNETKDGKLYYTQQFSWMNDLGRSSNPVPQKASYPYTDNPDWEDKFILGECVNGSLSSMSTHTQELLKPCMVQSLLLIPVHLHGYFWGFINFDDCHSERTFTEEEINILRSASLMMVNAVNRHAQTEKIEEAHERAQLLLDSSPLCCILWDSNFNRILCNEAAVKLFNLKNKQEFLDRIFELMPEYQSDGMLSTEKAEMMINKAFDTRICIFEWMHQMLDGTPMPSEVTLVRTSYDGEYVVAGYIRDLREHNQMMKGLEQRDVMLQTVNQAATILLQSEVDNFRDNLWKSMGMMAAAVHADRVYIWKNYTKEGRLYSTQLYEWSEGAEPQQGNQYVTDVADDDIPGWEKIRKGDCYNAIVRDLSPHEQASLTPQGILSVLVVPVFLQDEFWGFVGFDDCHNERLFTDNEETILRSGSLLIAHAFLRNEMTLNIRDSAARLEAVLSNYSGVIYSVDRNNIITLFNGLYLSKIGVTPSFLEGKNLNLAAKKNRHLDLIEYVKKTFEEGMPQDWFSEIDGKAFRAHTMPIFDENGKAVSLVGSLDDITDMKRLQTDLEAALEKAQDASRAKSNFLSNMSHEIRTPMNAIIGMTYIGKSASSIEKKDYAFDKIEGASNHLLGVINDVLEMSKIESGKFELSFIEFNFEKMLQKVVNVISFRVEEKKQNFSVYLDGKIPQSIIGDDQRLAQIITNLLSNAIKFTPDEGSIRLAAVLENEEAGVFTIKVSVADSGIGINAEQQSRLFSSFEQAESSTSRKFGGTGLGLAISKHIVELMGGKIWVESELGKGAVFSFLIQIKAGREVYASPLLSGVDWSKVRILAVDDESEVQEYFLQIAESLGIACDAVGSGEEALKLVQNNHTYDIFFIDWQMPGMNGIELSQKIKEIIKGDSTIILISAFESNEIEQEARMVGVNDFLPKPLFPSAVAGCINKYIGQHGMADDSKKPEETESFLGYRLLLAEDVEINREILITMLEPYNLEIESALNGQEAVEMFSTKPEHYDLIFMDLQMPEMDGYEATHLIRELNFPKAKEIPIIAMTANVFKEDIAKCLEAGMNDHLGKPLDFNEVLTKLRIYLKPLAPRGVEPLF